MSLRERMGLEHPVVGAGLGGGLSRARLTLAVGEAGGLGQLGIMPPPLLRAELAAHRDRSTRPVAVNVLLPFARREHWDVAAQADALRGERRPSRVQAQAARCPGDVPDRALRRRLAGTPPGRGQPRHGSLAGRGRARTGLGTRAAPRHGTGGDPESLVDAGPLYAGECVARITEVRPAAEIVRALAGVDPAAP